MRPPDPIGAPSAVDALGDELRQTDANAYEAWRKLPADAPMAETMRVFVRMTEARATLEGYKLAIRAQIRDEHS